MCALCVTLPSGGLGLGLGAHYSLAYCYTGSEQEMGTLDHKGLEVQEGMTVNQHSAKRPGEH